jgi:hypothetical protein
MKAYTASYALIYVTTVKLQTVRCTVVDLTAAKFRPLVFPMPGFSLSSNTYILIYIMINSTDVLHILVITGGTAEGPEFESR